MKTIHVPRIKRSEVKYNPREKRLHQLANATERIEKGHVTMLPEIPSGELGGKWQIKKGKCEIFLSDKLKPKHVAPTKLHEVTECREELRLRKLNKKR